MTNVHINNRSRFDARYGMMLTGAAALAAGAGLAGGLAQHLDGLAGKLASAGAVGAGAAALMLTVTVMKTWSAARRSGVTFGPRAQPDPKPLLARAVRLALPAPAAPKAAKREENRAQSKAEKPRPDPRPSLEAERARLQAAGFSDGEISQIFVARESGGHGGGSPGSGVATGLLNNLGAVVAYARSFLPGLKADVVQLLDGGETAGARGSAALSLALKATVIGVVAYIASLEFSQLQAMVAKSKAEACLARMDHIAKDVSMAEWPQAIAQYNRDCGP